MPTHCEADGETFDVNHALTALEVAPYMKDTMESIESISRQGETRKRRPIPRQQRQDGWHSHQSLPLATLS